MTKFGPRQLAMTLGSLSIGLLGAAIVVHAGGTAYAVSQVESGLAVARRFQTASWLSLVCAQLFAVMVGVLPASFVGIAAGAVLGVAKGFAISGATVIAGAFASFALSRSVFRPFIMRVTAKRAGARSLDAAVGREGWRLVFLFRLSPIMPFAAASYAFGLSAVSLRDYMLGTLAALPPLLGYVAVGAAAESGFSATAGLSASLQWIFLTIGIAATSLACFQIGMLFRGRPEIGSQNQHAGQAFNAPSMNADVEP
jgi:uncharacterized membrane protein YdjX (TVP38/TMEM64 family)